MARFYIEVDSITASEQEAHVTVAVVQRSVTRRRINNPLRAFASALGHVFGRSGRVVTLSANTFTVDLTREAGRWRAVRIAGAD